MFSKLFKRRLKRKYKQDLREMCREIYGDDFITKYDAVNRGDPIGTLAETIVFLNKIEIVKKKMDEKKGNKT